MTPISQIQSNTGKESREIERKYSKGTGGFGAKTEDLTLLALALLLYHYR